MQFVYPARFEHTAQGDVVVAFRDLPECLTSGTDEADAFTEASDALEESIAGRIADGDAIPTPSAARAGENEVPVPPGMAAKAALVVALRKSGGRATNSPSCLACTSSPSEKCWTRTSPRRQTGSTLLCGSWAIRS